MATNGIFLPSSFGSALPYLAQAGSISAFVPCLPVRCGEVQARAVSYHGARIAFKKALKLIRADPAFSAFFEESIVALAFFLLFRSLFC